MADNAGYASFKFDASSKRALKAIEQNTQLSNTIRKVMVSGSLFDIFTSRKATEMAFSVYQSDFVSLAKAIQGLNDYECGVLKQTAKWEILNHYGEEKRFWEKVNASCTFSNQKP